MYFYFFNLITYFVFSINYYYYQIYNLKLYFVLNFKYLNLKQNRLYKITKQLLYLLYLFKKINSLKLYISKNSYIKNFYLYQNLNFIFSFNISFFYNNKMLQNYLFLKKQKKHIYYQENINANYKLKHFFIPFKKNINIFFFYYKINKLISKYSLFFNLQIYK